MGMTMVFTCFAAVFSLGGWLMPHLLHRLGYRMAVFYLVLAVASAVIGLARRQESR